MTDDYFQGDDMTMHDVPAWLRERRRALGLQQGVVEEATAQAGEHARVTQSYLSKLERGVRPLSSLTPVRQDALRRALELSASEWAARSGLTTLLAPAGDEVVGGLEVVRVPVRALAVAGWPVSEDDASIIDAELVPQAEYRSGMIVLEVQGDSMTTPGGGGIRGGDRIYVDPHDLGLREGRVYVLHVPGSGLVVKRLRRFDEVFWLTSDNPDYPPLRPEQAKLVGRVYFHQPRGSRL